MSPKKKLKTGGGEKAKFAILNKNCTICGKDVTSVCNAEKTEGTPTLFNDYLQGLRRHVPEEIQYERIEDEITCQGCSKDIGLVKNGTNKMEKLQNEISELERTLQEKLSGMKSAGKIVLLGYEQIEKSVNNETLASNLSQNKIFIRKGTEKASIELKKTLARLEDKVICNEKHLIGNEVRAAIERPSGTSQTVSVTSSATKITDEFEATEVSQVKMERSDDNAEVASTIESEPEIEDVIKLEDEPIRETRQGIIYRRKKITLPVSTLQSLQIVSRNENKEPEMIDLEVEEDEVTFPTFSKSFIPSSVASSHELPVALFGDVWNCEEKTKIIVKNVAGYINGVQDLKSVRVLNNTWLKETFEKWRRSAVFLINDETFPILVNAFQDANDVESSEQNNDLTEKEKAESFKTIDPFQLREFPFKKYRFTESQAWNYPLDDRADSENKIIVWKRCINPHATYLDVGECIFNRYFINPHCCNNNFPGLAWILNHSSNVTDLALAPIQFAKYINLPSIRYCLPWNRLLYHCLYGGEMPKADKVVSISMTSPQLEEDDEDYTSFFDGLGDDAAQNIFRSLPNLKKLKLPNSYNMDTIEKALEWASRDGPCIKLESVDALALKGDWSSLNESFYEYLNNDGCLKSLREFKISTGFDNVIHKEYEEDSGHIDRKILRLILKEGSLTKLELLVDCKMEDTDNLPSNTDLFFGLYNFPNLTHLKVEQEYDTFGTLVTFYFNDLKKMPNLREFHFGIKICIFNNKSFEMEWLTRKLDFPNTNESTEEAFDFKLTDLRFFHFHGNFENQALTRLGKIMENLKTLEIVIDQENFAVVLNIWPWLINLKLLPCSDVPEEEILKHSNPFLNIADESRKWSTAVRSLISE